MSVMKMKWIKLLDSKRQFIDYAEFESLLKECDDLFNKKLQGDGESVYSFTSLADAYDNMWAFFFDSDEENNIWSDLDIFVSSFKKEDIRIFMELRTRLLQYLGFYKKILSDDGVARKMVTHRTYSGSGSSEGVYKNYYSETPQVNLTNFDDAINYASNLEKNEDGRSTSKEGESDYELKSFNWDEALKNMKMVFYNDLIRYINSIPLLVYNYYALEQYPVGYSIEKYFETLKDLYARR